MFAKPFKGEHISIEKIVMKRTKFGRISVDIHTEDKVKYSYLVKIGCEHKSEFIWVNGRDEKLGNSNMVSMFGTNEKEVNAILNWCEL
jgi:hypothetical protein